METVEGQGSGVAVGKLMCASVIAGQMVWMENFYRSSEAMCRACLDSEREMKECVAVILSFFLDMLLILCG